MAASRAGRTPARTRRRWLLPLLMTGLLAGVGGRTSQARPPAPVPEPRVVRSPEGTRILLATLERGRATLIRDLVRRAPARRRAIAPTEDPAARRREAAAANSYRRASRRPSLNERRRTRHGLRGARDARLRGLRSDGGPARASSQVLPAARTGLPAIQGLLDAREAAVSLGTRDGRLRAVVATRDAAWHRDLGSLARWTTLVTQCSPTEPEQDVVGCDAKLEQRLMMPLDLPPEVESLVISSSDLLHGVPLALAVGRRRAIRVPSLATWRALREGRHAREPGVGVLAIGAPLYADSQTHGARIEKIELPPLPTLDAARQEVTAIADAALLGASATERTLARALSSRGQLRALHIAAHGIFRPERPWFSGIVLTPTHEDDGLLTVHEVMRLRVGADLVVLSACNTALGGGVAGETSIGLPAAFLAAGSHAVLGALWRVDDDATSALMRKFHEIWRAPGRQASAASALRQAQAHVRRQPRWRHPYYWAGWSLWGDPS